MENDILAELRSAYQEQRQEFEASMGRFLERVAHVCDEHTASPQSLACAVRDLASEYCKGEDHPHGSIDADVVKASEKITSPSASAKKLSSVKLMKESTSDEVDERSALHDRLPSTAEASRQSGKDMETQEALEDREDAAKIEHEFNVPRLAFIAADGAIAHSESFLDRVLRRRLNRITLFQASCLQPRTAGCFAEFVDGVWFKILSATMIMLNYFFIVYQTDYKMNHLHGDETYVMFLIELCFTVFYVWELSCMMLVYRKDFFIGHEMLWNLFDTGIVLVSVFELVISLLGGKSMNLSFLRILRFVKISRILRMFSALRLMKEIRIMVDALTGSFVIFVFCSIMFAMFFSIFAIFFVQGITAFLENTTDIDAGTMESIQADFASVSKTMLSLFMSISGGHDWERYHVTIAAVGHTYNFLFLFFIAFTFIAFLNVITGVFAEKAMSLASPTVDELMVKRTEKETKDAKELVSLLHRLVDSDQNCVLTAETFEKFLDQPEVVKYLEIRGLKPCSARRFFALILEIKQTDCIDFGTFVSACVKLDGTASSIDLHVLSAELKSMQLKQLHLNKFLKDNLRTMARSSRPSLGESQQEQDETTSSSTMLGSGDSTMATASSNHMPEFCGSASELPVQLNLSTATELPSSPAELLAQSGIPSVWSM